MALGASNHSLGDGADGRRSAGGERRGIPCACGRPGPLAPPEEAPVVAVSLGAWGFEVALCPGARAGGRGAVCVLPPRGAFPTAVLSPWARRRLTQATPWAPCPAGPGTGGRGQLGGVEHRPPAPRRRGAPVGARKGAGGGAAVRDAGSVALCCPGLPPSRPALLCLTKEPSPVGQSGCEQTSWGRASSALTSSRCFSRASRRQRAGRTCPSEPGPVRCRVAQFSCPCFDCWAPGRFFLLAAVKSSARGTLEEMSVSGHFLVDSETRPAVVLGARLAAVRRDGWRGSSLAHCCRRPLTTPPSVLQAS